MVESKSLSRLSVNQVRLILGFVALAVVAGGIYLSVHRKTLVSDFNAPGSCGATCTETITSSDALVANGGYGGAFGPIGSGAYPGQYAAGGGGNTDTPLPNGGCDGNGDHYDGNFWGLRGQTASFTTNPVWWYSPPTATGTSLSCKNTWGAGSPTDLHKSYHNLYGANNTGNRQSLYEDPAAFLNPAGNNGNSGIGPGWASNPDFTAGKTTWPNVQKVTAVDANATATSGWANNAPFVTCADCTNNTSGQTFVYRVTFDTLDPTKWQITNVSLRYQAIGWAAAWIDSTGGMTTDTTGNKSSTQGNETPFPCQNTGACPIQYDDATGNLSGNDGAGGALEIGVGQTDCNSASKRCGDLGTILSNGTRHVLAIQGSAKSYNCAFGTTGCNSVTNTPAIAYWLQISYQKVPPVPSVSFSKTYKNSCCAQPQGSVPVLRPGTGDTVDFTNSATFSLDPTDTGRAIHYTITDNNPSCLTSQNGNTSSGNFTLNQATTPVTVKWDTNFKVNNTCASDQQYTNTATITWDETDGRTWTGTMSDTAPYIIITPYLPWIQTQFGDVHSNGNINTNPGSVATYIVSAAGTINGFNSAKCLVFLSSSCSVTFGSYGTLAWPWQENPNFYSDLNANAVTGTFASGSTVSGNLGNGTSSSFYTVTGGCTINLGAITVRGAVTIFVPCASATVNVTGNIAASNANGTPKGIPALGIIAGNTESSGNNCSTSSINIDNLVSSLTDVVLFTSGTIQTSDSQTSNQLVMRGGLIGCKIDLTNRIGAPGSNPPAAEVYNYVGNFILNPPPGFLNLSQSGSSLQYNSESIPQL